MADWAIYGALIAGFLAVAGATAYLVERVLEGWRALKRLRRNTGRALEQLADAAERVADSAGAATDTADLGRSLARLRASQARLAVLRAAWDDALGPLRAVTAVYPRR